MSNGNTARERQIIKNTTPSPAAVGSYGGGEDFGSPFGGGSTYDPPGTTNEAAVPYGGPPSAYNIPVDTGGGTDTGDNIIFNQGAAETEDTSSGFPMNLDAYNKLYGGNVYDYLVGAGVDIGDMLEHGGAENPDLIKLMQEIQANKSGFYVEPFKGEAGFKNIGDSDWDASMNVNPMNQSVGFTIGTAFQEGGLASLANPHVGERDQRTEDYRRILDRAMGGMQGLGGGLGGLEGLGSMGQAQMSQPSQPFGATRENELEQLEAWGNAPHHVDPPNIGFHGEKIPAPLYNKIIKYLEGVSPAERTLLEEMINRKGLERFKDKFRDKYDNYPCLTPPRSEPIEV